jgi:predicted nucleic acid-binding protein
MSGTEKQKLYYWDACIYLAWLQNEIVHGQTHLDAIKQVATANDNRQNIIISSTLVFTEVLAAKIGTENEQIFRKSFRSQNHIAYDVDPPIAIKAMEFRQNLQTIGKSLRTPDAIHLATALIQKADEVWTFDDKLLALNKDSKVEGLVICKPYTPQGILI